MRILICEDSVLLREGLVRLLEHSGHDVVAALTSTEGVTEAVAETRPDLCILDVRLPPTFSDEGIRLALELRRTQPTLPLLVLSQYVEERYASDLVAEAGGGLGYLLKDRVADVSDFISSVEHCARRDRGGPIQSDHCSAPQSVGSERREVHHRHLWQARPRTRRVG